jgi:hypothetical protein
LPTKIIRIIILCLVFFSCINKKNRTSEQNEHNIIGTEHESFHEEIMENISEIEIYIFQKEARVIEIIDYNINHKYHTAVFLDENNDNIFDKILHISNTGSGLTFGNKLRDLLKEGDIIKYEYGKHVKPQWEEYAKDLYEEFKINSDLIIDTEHLLEINGITIVSYFNDYTKEHWKHYFPYLKIDTLCDCFMYRTVAYAPKPNITWSVRGIRSNEIKFEELPLEETGFAVLGINRRFVSHTGTFLFTNIIEDNVLLLSYPSFKSKINYTLNNNDIVRIMGYSDINENIDDCNGYWIYIIFQKDINPYIGDNDEYFDGWIFSKYVNISDIKYSPLKYIEFIQNTNRMKMSYNLQGNEVFFEQNYDDYIMWGPFSNLYHYSTRPGLYILNKETQKLNFVKYLNINEFHSFNK